MSGNYETSPQPVLYPISQKRSAKGGGGCMNPINCFAQQNKGSGMTLTPPSLHKKGLENANPGGNKENITAALEGIRAMKEVLSRQELRDATASAAANNGNGSYGEKPLPPLSQGQAKVMQKVDQALASHQVSGPLQVTPKSSSLTQSTALNHAAGGGSGGPGSAASSAFTLSTEPSLIDMGEIRSSRSATPTHSRDKTLKRQGSGTPQSQTSSTRDVSSMLHEVLGSNQATPLHSPTQALAHSLWIKDQQQQGEEGEHAGPRFRPRHAIAGLVAVLLFKILKR
mmetsp:Transcript_6160/g.15198  ORF Transcript_6160/g.15198 Transcript_6160/m.15198 type:complete len:284 (+) Transcript_6160:100-951(+)